MVNNNQALLKQYLNDKYGGLFSNKKTPNQTQQNTASITSNTNNSKMVLSKTLLSNSINEIKEDNNKETKEATNTLGNCDYKLKEVFQSQLNFSQTFNINNLNYDLLGSILLGTNNSNTELTKNDVKDPHLDITGESGQNTSAFEDEDKGKLKYEAAIKDFLGKVSKALDGQPSVVFNVSFIYYALKVPLK